MRSPKFGIRKDELSKVLNPQSLKLAWKNTVRIAMRRQYISDPIEFMDFHSRIQNECVLLATQISEGTYSPKKPKRVLVEKSKGLCRQLAVLDVRDAIVLQCLSDAFYSNIKDKSPSKNAFFEPERHLFTGPLNEKRTYGSFRSWLEFQKHIFNFTKTRNYILITDVANFYDCISHTNLRNIITDYVDDVRESILDLLIFVLAELNWQPDYMPRADVGLPQIDLDAPRLIAHCFLYELDKMMSRRSDVDYVRFMDDIDIGVDSIPEARRILRDIDLMLHARQVRLNAGKTTILSDADARQHFKITENEYIASIEAFGKEAAKDEKKLPDLRNAISSTLSTWFAEGTFNTGNGDKILKRLFGLSIRFKAPVSREILVDCLQRRPGVRDAVYRYMCYMSPNIESLNCILDYLENDYAVDDASYLDFANYLVDSTCLFDDATLLRIHRLLDQLRMQGNDTKIYCVLKLISKIGDSSFVETVIDATYDKWKADTCSGRIIGSIWPLVLGTSYESNYNNIVTKSRNIGAIDVLDYLKSIADNRDAFVSVRSIVRAPNDSLPNRISHAKFIVLHSVLHGHAVSDSEKAELRQIHRAAVKDPYYSRVIGMALRAVQ